MKNLSKALGLLLMLSALLVMSDERAHAAAPPGHFTDRGDGTVFDNLTGLTWEVDFSVAQTRAAAVTYCNGLTATLPGAAWRVPTILELRSLIDDGAAPWMMDPLFPTPATQPFWSATRAARFLTYSWTVDFSTGRVDVFDGGLLGRTRCVR